MIMRARECGGWITGGQESSCREPAEKCAGRIILRARECG